MKKKYWWLIAGISLAGAATLVYLAKKKKEKL